MPSSAFTLPGLVAGVLLIAMVARNMLVRSQSRRRLRAPLRASERERLSAPRPQAPPSRSIFRRHLLVPWVLAIVTLAGCFYLLHLKLLFCVAFAIVVELLAGQIESQWIQHRMAKIDQQLADSLDLMISTLRAGASVVAAMERAASEVKTPLKTELSAVLGLIRYGDEPRSVMRRLAARVPLESFRLFTVTMAVHFEVGGSLAPTLAIVGRIVRDRIEVAGRIRSLTSQARASTAILIFVTYGIAYLMWRHDPPGIAQFVNSRVGSAAVAGSMILQAVGIVWQSSMSKLRQ